MYGSESINQKIIHSNPTLSKDCRSMTHSAFLKYAVCGRSWQSYSVYISCPWAPLLTDSTAFCSAGTMYDAKRSHVLRRISKCTFFIRST